ncbi:hypothetical protein ACJ2A9_00040 [Anaerobacillus sp. MEB173]|uniref:hypothetical protein n=1 Tax=Anaerobacillus sp. MEB173 TaxID=3383345 RepID=UPI003F91B9E4
MYYRQHPITRSSYTQQQYLMDSMTGEKFDYELISPYQAQFRNTPNYLYNPSQTMYPSFPLNQESSNSREIGTEFLGLVQNGRFRIIWPRSVSGIIKLTKDPIYIGRPIEELSLENQEGKVMLVGGDYRGEWIYRVKIIEEAGPILAIVTKELFKVSDEYLNG